KKTSRLERLNSICSIFAFNKSSSSSFSFRNFAASSKRLAFSKLQLWLGWRYSGEGDGSCDKDWSCSGRGGSKTPYELPKIGGRAAEGTVSQLSSQNWACSLIN